MFNKLFFHHYTERSANQLQLKQNTSRTVFQKAGLQIDEKSCFEKLITFYLLFYGEKPQKVYILYFYDQSQTTDSD